MPTTILFLISRVFFGTNWLECQLACIMWFEGLFVCLRDG